MSGRILSILCLCLILISLATSVLAEGGIQLQNKYVQGRVIQQKVDMGTGIPAGGVIRLEHKYVQGQVLRYRVNTVMSVGVVQEYGKPGHVASMTITGDFSRRIVRVLANGDAEIVFNFEGFRANCGLIDQPLQQMNPVSVVVSRTGEIKSMVGASGNPLEQLTFMNPTVFGQLSVAFVDAELKAGSTWDKESTFKLDGGTTGSLKAHYVFGGFNASGGRTVSGFDEKEVGKTQYSAAGSQGERIHAINSWQASNRFSFSVDNGCIAVVSGNSTNRMNVIMPASQGNPGQTVNLDIKMQYQAILQQEKTK